MVWSSAQANTEMPHVQRKFWMNGKDVVYLLDTPVAIDEECNPRKNVLLALGTERVGDQGTCC